MPHRLLDYTFTMQLQRPVMWRGAVMLAATGILLSACYQAPAPVVRGSASSQHTTQQTTVPQPVEKPKSEPRIIVADSADSRVVPLPRSKPSPTEKTTSSPAIKAPVAASGTVRVGAGDTVYALSRHHNIGVRDIIHANQLKPPYKLLVGQTLRLPIARFHTARAGETLYGLSQQYGVDMSALVRANACAPDGCQTGTAGKAGSQRSTDQAAVARLKVFPVAGRGAPLVELRPQGGRLA
jgi:LysM repeat protein